MIRRLLTLFAASLAIVLVLAACDTNSDDSQTDDVPAASSPSNTTEPETDTADEPAETEVPETTDDAAASETEEPAESEPTETATEDDAAATETPDAEDSSTDGASADSDADTSSPNVITVSDAGEVEIERDGNRLVLVEVRANDGWEYHVDDNDSDEIEVDFRMSGREVDFDAEIEGDQVKIEIDDKWRDGSDGVHTVAEAGEVEFTRDGNQLELIEVRASDGWEYRIDEDDADEINVTFVSDGLSIEFEAEVDDGRLEIEIQTEERRDI